MRLLLLIPLIISPFLFGQEETKNKSRHLIGLNANTISGVGLSYRYEINRFASQFTFSGFKYGSRIKYNVGGSVMHQFHQSKKGDFYFGFSSRYKQMRDVLFVREGDQLKKNSIWTNQLNAGIHFDYLRRYENNLSLNISLGYGLYNIFGRVLYFNEDDFPKPVGPSEYKDLDFNFGVFYLATFFTGGVALYYHF